MRRDCDPGAGIAVRGAGAEHDHGRRQRGGHDVSQENGAASRIIRSTTRPRLHAIHHPAACFGTHALHYGALLSMKTSHNVSEENPMSKKAAEHHKKASEHLTHAAHHHGEAAKHHDAGHHEKAAHHAHTARGHVIHARKHAEDAVMAHAEEHGKK
jgi:hypothetical protein